MNTISFDAPAASNEAASTLNGAAVRAEIWSAVRDVPALIVNTGLVPS